MTRKLEPDVITYKGRRWERQYHRDKRLGLDRYEWRDELGFVAGPKLRHVLNIEAHKLRS